MNPQKMTRRVIIVAADPLSRSALARDLRSTGTVVQAARYDRALALLDADPSIACVVADMDLGDGPDGLELLAAVEARRPAVGRVLVADLTRAVDQGIASGLIDWFIERADVAREIARAVEYASEVRAGGKM